MKTSWMSAKACVTHQATWPLWPKCGKHGTPGTEKPSASKASQAIWVWAYMLGSSNWRCGSPASKGRPAAVRAGASAQLLLPPPVESGAPSAATASIAGARSFSVAIQRCASAPGGMHSSSRPPSS